jgi:hypothetical protein
MVDEWKRTEILLEGIKNDLKAATEGHAILLRKIDTGIADLRRDFSEQLSDIKTIVKDHSNDMKEIKSDLREIKSDLKGHIRQAAPPAHVSF